MPVLTCCSGSKSQVIKSFAAFGCGAFLKIAPVKGQIGVASTVEKCDSTGLPAFFSGSVMLKIESNVTQFCPDAMLRCWPRWPWMKFGLLAIYLSM